MKYDIIRSVTAALSLCVGGLFPAWCLAECPAIILHYNERVPYLVTTTKGVEGLTATPAQQAFKKAGVPFKWNITPSIRQMNLVQENRGCDCLVGWFKTPEREQFAKYTLPIYQDQPQIAIARSDNTALHSGMRVDDLLSNPKLIMGAKDGYSYGDFLDEKIARYKPNIDKTTAENIQMLMKIHGRRNDYFFIAPEEADSLIASSGFPKEDFQYVTFSNMPLGESRYILCSQQVSDAVIEQLNAVIKTEILPNIR